jgi:hypothetical protein
MQKIALLVVFSLFGALNLLEAQTKYTLSGRLTDDAGEPLGAASVMLLQASDSILQSFAITAPDGQFSFADVPAGEYVFKAIYLKHRNLAKSVSVNGEATKIDMGQLKMTPESSKIDDVEITDERVPVRFKGDTIEYDAKAFTVQPNANVEELFKRLPGMEVDRDGNIKAQGEEVTKILVDGKEFFGDDPKVASRNLPAESVDKVQVFDKMSDVSEFTGIDDGTRTRTINLTLKDDYKTGYFGNVSAGYGTKERFEAKANLNRFGDKSQLSFLGQANNTNQQSFTMKDYMGFVGGMGNLMNSSDPTQSMSAGDLGLNLSSNPNSGFFTTGAGGLNGNWTPNEKTQITTSYFYNYLRKDISRDLFKETILDEGSFLTNQSGDQTDKNQNHRVSFYWKQDLDTLTKLSLRVNYKTNAGNSAVNDTVNSTQITGFETQSEQHYISNSGLDEINPTLNLMHRFRKRGRSATLTGSFRYNPQDQGGDLTSANQFQRPDTNLLQLDTLRQNQLQDQGLISYNGRFGYTEPVGLHHAFEGYFQYQQTDNTLDKTFYDLDPDGANPVLNPILSSSYQTTYRYERLGINWRYYNQNLNVTTGVAVQNSDLNGEIYTTNTLIRKNFLNILPSVALRLKMAKSQNIRLNYTTRVNEPTVAQLQPVPNNSNPLNITVGNPELQAEYAHNVRFHYNLFDQFSFTSFFAMLSTTYTTNKISQRTTVDSLLRQVTMPVNVDNDLQVNGFLSFSTPIRKLKMKFAVNGNSSVGRSLVYINNALNVVNRFTNGGDIRFENKTKDHFDANVGGRTSYTVTQYPNATQLNQSYLNSGLFGEVTVYLPKKFVVMTGMDCSIYSGAGFDSNQIVPLWRAYVSKKIFKNGRGELRITANDILNKNIGISRTAQLNYQQQETVNTLSRYFLGSFTYAIVSVGNKR